MPHATRVLVVDDDSMTIELITEYLRGPRFEVVAAGDGAAAWSILEREGADLDVVLRDRMMPGIDGLEVLRRVKRHPRLANLPVIMQTALADSEDVVEGIAAGAFYYLTKPFDQDVLVTMVGAAAADHERYRELQREVRTQAGLLGLIRLVELEYRTPKEATDLGTLLAKACPDPERVVLGLSELLVNAVEHGNLGIGYADKSELTRSGTWEEEIARRLALPELAARVATVRLERDPDAVTITIRDQGQGFDPTPYLQIDPDRVFDSHGRGIALANLLSFDALEYRDGGRVAVATVAP
jgi:CheY-like chemotaxis protein